MTKKDLESLRHSTAHVMAQAVKELWPDVKVAIGPSTEDGFYYDFDRDETFTEDDLKKISQRMKEIIKKKLLIEKIKLSEKEIKKILKDEPYKQEIYDEIIKLKEKPTFYKQGDFIDICKGPHLDNTKEIKAFKLLRTAAAYWRGDSKNKQLQRIYGTAFYSKEELKEYLKNLEEAIKRDHNKLGRTLDLFMTSEVVGKGLPLLKPKGATLKRILKRFIEDEEIKRGYLYTETPVLAKTKLYEISGHLNHYRDSMFIFKENNEEIALRPMTCPHQFMIYNSKKRSYKELPLRYAEVASLFRKEQSGELHGLIRVWQFTLADAHIICTPEQLEEEFKKTLELIQYIMKCLGFTDYWYRFSKWDPSKKGKKYIDNPKAWEKSQETMKKILKQLKLDYVEKEDEAAFYGPKLDIEMKNVYGKEDTIFTIQIDFALPERFDMTYVNEKDQEVRPMIIHRSSIGCLERTMALLIEKYAGKFPFWLSPVQIKILNINDTHKDYAYELKNKFMENNLRSEVNDKAESINKKVRTAQKENVYYTLIIGDEEIKNQTVSVRDRQGNIKKNVKIDEFINQCLEKEKNKSVD